MSNEIQPVNLNDAAEKLRDAIKSAFVELLTPEQWQAMVRECLERFLKPRYQNGVTISSELESIVRLIFTEHIKGLLKTEMANNQTWGAVDQDGRTEVSKLVHDYLDANQHKLAQVVVGELVGAAIQGVINNIGTR